MYFKPKISILIPCYNAEHWIAQAIESSLNQTYSNIEVIVVDDGSTDNSLTIIKSFGDRLHWETGENRGGNSARNRLLELSSGEWLQYLDADDYLLPNKIAEQIECLKSDPTTDVIYSPHITENIDDDGKLTQNEHWLSNIPLPHDLWLYAIQWKLPQTGGLLIKKQALLDINGWQEGLKHCQDYDLYVRLLIANKKFVYCSSLGAVYRWWCSGTVTHRKISEIYHDRLNIQEMIESYLSKTNLLTAEKQDAINQARFEYARRIYSWDKQWATKVVSTLQNNHSNFEPSEHVAPNIYRKIYKLFGFRTAEYAAKLRRKSLNS